MTCSKLEKIFKWFSFSIQQYKFKVDPIYCEVPLSSSGGFWGVEFEFVGFFVFLCFFNEATNKLLCKLLSFFFSKKLDKFTLLELQCISLCFCIAFLMVFPHQVGKVILQIVTRSWQYACKYYLTSNTQLSVT